MNVAYPVPEHARQTEHEWARLLALRFGVDETDFRARPPKFMQFPPSTCRVELMDGSIVELRWAFAIASTALQAVAVFSEHCGHHVFPLHDARVFEDGVQKFPSP